MGYINNMRPRGILYSSTELTEEKKLVGSCRMRGVKLEQPPGVKALDATSFEFRRAATDADGPH